MSESSINTSKDLNVLLEKLENDNKLLAELDCKLKKVNNSYDNNESLREQNTDSKLANNSSHQLMSTSMPSLYQSSSSLTDTTAGSQAIGRHQTSHGQSVGSGLHQIPIHSKLSSNPSNNQLLAQNGKLTQQLLDRIDAELDLDLDLLEMDFEKHIPLRNHLIDDNDLLLKTRSSINTNISNKYTKLHSKSDGLPYHHNYDPIIKYTGASDKSKSS